MTKHVEEQAETAAEEDRFSGEEQVKERQVQVASQEALAVKEKVFSAKSCVAEEEVFGKSAVAKEEVSGESSIANKEVSGQMGGEKEVSGKSSIAEKEVSGETVGEKEVAFKDQVGLGKEGEEDVLQEEWVILVVRLFLEGECFIIIIIKLFQSN